MKSPPPIRPIAIEALCANLRKKSGRGGIVISHFSPLDEMRIALLLTPIWISNSRTLARGSSDYHRRRRCAKFDLINWRTGCRRLVRPHDPPRPRKTTPNQLLRPPPPGTPPSHQPLLPRRVRAT